MSIQYYENSREFHLWNDQISYSFSILKNGHLGNLYFGRKLRERESFGHFLELARRDMAPCAYESDSAFSLEHIRQEYSGYGNGDMRVPAYEIQCDNGSYVTDFVYDSYRICPGKPKLPGLPATYVESEDEAETLEITLTDALIQTDLILSYTIWRDLPVITRNCRFVCRNPKGIRLLRALSLNLDLPDCDYEMLDLSGAWARERDVRIHPLHRGIQSIQSLRGHSSHQFNPFLALLRPGTDENRGEVIGFSLIYSGNFLAQVEVDTCDVTRVTMGIHPQQFCFPLAKGEFFQTPEAVMVYSANGMNHMSQTFHTLYRTRLARGYWRDRVRPILLNSWEAVYMKFDEEKILAIAEKSKELGVELFVLDDGWFGHRDDATTSLGDWFPYLDKIPHGISGLAQKVTSMGIRFGLWIEPEMISTDSELFRKHPDWRLEVPGRVPCQGRNQYVLDFSRTEIVDAIGDMLEKLLSESPISYIKWDMNRSLTDVYSAVLPAERQGTVFHNYVLGVYRLYERLTSRFPEVLFESCASGGARFDPGMLYYAPQGWISDDTDAVERLKIQYGTSIVYPLSCMGSHVSAVPNHQVFRNTPMDTRAAVAYFGTFGYELDPTKLTEEEKEAVKKQIAFMQEHRELIARGTFYRLKSPFEGNETAWMVISENKKQAIVGYYRVLQPVNIGYRRLRLAGLSEDVSYRINGEEAAFYGDELMYAGMLISDGASGVNIPGLYQGDYQARLFLLNAEE